MQTITTIGLDIAKSVFQVHAVDDGGLFYGPDETVNIMAICYRVGFDNGSNTSTSERADTKDQLCPRSMFGKPFGAWRSNNLCQIPQHCQLIACVLAGVPFRKSLGAPITVSTGRLSMSSGHQIQSSH